MYRLCVALVLVFEIITRSNALRHDDLPPIFRIDNYTKCQHDRKMFCNVEVILSKARGNGSNHWKAIEESINDSETYNRNALFHAICVEDFCSGQTFRDDVHPQQLSRCYTGKYERLGLKADVKIHSCVKSDRNRSIQTFDVIYLVVAFTYFGFVLVISYLDFLSRKEARFAFSKGFQKYCLNPFSLVGHCEKLVRTNSSPDFQKLKCMQGMRFYNMLLIIFCHTFSSYIGGYVLNTDYFEKIEEDPFKLGLRNLLVFLVQTYFLFSAFLLSYHTFQLMKSSEFKTKFIYLTFLNRYLRIIPPVIVMVASGCTTWLLMIYNGPLEDLYSKLEYQMCRRNWWTSLLFLSNHYMEYEMCCFTLWYLSADTQLYILSLVILALVWKYRDHTRKILLSCIAVGVLIQIVISYVHNVDVIYRLTPENSKYKQFRSHKFSVIYTSTYANMATYMVGLYAGYVYFKYEKRDVFTTFTSKGAWLLSFLGLPLLVLVVSSYQYSRLTSAILCGLLKPIYALGIAIGVFGMSQKLGGPVRRLCEWRPAVLMGNFTYSTYLIHYGIVFYRTATARELFYVSDVVILRSFIYDAILSFFFGFIAHVLIEMPASQLQDMLVPHIRKQRQSKHCKTEK